MQKNRLMICSKWLIGHRNTCCTHWRGQTEWLYPGSNSIGLPAATPSQRKAQAAQNTGPCKYWPARSLASQLSHSGRQVGSPVQVVQLPWQIPLGSHTLAGRGEPAVGEASSLQQSSGCHQMRLLAHQSDSWRCPEGSLATAEQCVHQDVQLEQSVRYSLEVPRRQALSSGIADSESMK